MALVHGQRITAEEVERIVSREFSPRDFASLCNAISWASSGRRCSSLPSFTERENVRDLGIDVEWETEILDAGENNSALLGSGWNVFQYKKRDIFARDREQIFSNLKANLKGAIKDLHERTGRCPNHYVLFTNIDLSHEQKQTGKRVATKQTKGSTRKRKSNPLKALKDCILFGYDQSQNVHVEVVGAAELASFLNDLPHIRSAYFATNSFIIWEKAWQQHARTRIFGANVQLTSRDNELSKLCTLVNDSRVRAIIVLGPHAIGKTRLVLEATKHRPIEVVAALDPHSISVSDLSKLESPQNETVVIIDDPEPDQARRFVDHALASEKLKLLITLPTTENASLSNYGRDDRVQLFRLNPLTEEQSEKLLQSAGAKLDFSVGSWIIEQAGGIPGALLFAASSSAEYSKDQFRDSVRQHLIQFNRGDISGRPLDELVKAYREQLARRVSSVRIFGEAEPRPLEKVFVELNIIKEYLRSSIPTQWLGVMDAKLRQRCDIFARQSFDLETRIVDVVNRDDQTKQTLKSDALLRNRAQAVIVGAPGCGKTTLLRYFTWKTIQEGKYFPVFLELKRIAFDTVKGDLALHLFDKAVVGSEALSATERDNFHQFFTARLKAGEVAIFLDGLDEVANTEFFSSLRLAIENFMHSAYHHNLLIISTRPYALPIHFEGLQQMEIAPLTPKQIEAFLDYYYGDDLSMKQLVQELRRRHEVRELAYVPFLLGVIAYLYRQQGKIIDDRLELYERIILELAIQLNKDKNIKAFRSHDPDGWLKLEFLKQLAYERLLVDEVENDAERLIFTSEIIAKKANKFCQEHQITNFQLLAAAAKATPLLREIGTDAYAFVHLTMQEYLAAKALVEQPDCEKTFCRAYFNTTLAEMEVLPMTLGLVRQPDPLYAVLEKLPESSSFYNFRLRVRSLAYMRKLSHEYLTPLIERFLKFISEPKDEEIPYKDAIIRAFLRAHRFFWEFIQDRIARLLLDTHKSRNMRTMATFILGQIGNERNVETLLKILKDQDIEVRGSAAWALGLIGSERAIEALVDALKDTFEVQYKAAFALGFIGTERVIEALRETLKDKDAMVRAQTVLALGFIRSEHSVEVLFDVLQNDNLSSAVVGALCRIGSEKSVDALRAALRGKTWHECDQIAEGLAYLGEIGIKRAVDALLCVLKDEDSVVRRSAAHSLRRIKSERVVDALLDALKDNDINVRKNIIDALGEIGHERSIDIVVTVLKNENSYLRMCAAQALGKIGGARSIDPLLMAIKNNSDSRVRWYVVDALGRIQSERSVEVLLEALHDDASMVRRGAIIALGGICGERALQDLLPALHDKDMFVRQSVIEVLGKIGTKRCVEAMFEALKGDIDLFNHIYMVLMFRRIDIDSEKVVDTLLNILKDKNSDQRRYAASMLGDIGTERAIDALVDAMTDKDSEVRRSAVYALGKIGDERSFEMMLSALKDGDNQVRCSAAHWLGQSDNAHIVPNLLVCLRDDHGDVRSAAAEELGKMNSIILSQGLVNALDYNDSFVRQKAAQVVGYYTTDEQTRATLHHLATNDPAEEVRTAAREAAEKYANKLRYFAE